MAGAEHLFQVAAAWLLGIEPFHRVIGEAGDGLEQVIEFVGHAAGELPDPLQFLRLAEFLFGLLVDDHLGSGLRQVREERVVFLGKRTLRKHPHDTRHIAARIAQLVAGERYESKVASPLVTGDRRVRDDVVAQQLFLHPGRDLADFVVPQRHAAMIAVDMRVASRAGHEVQALVVAAARGFHAALRGMHAARLAEVAGLHAPDAAEVEVEQAHGGIGDLLELLLQGRGQNQFCLQPVEAFQPFQGADPRRVGQLALGNVFRDPHKVQRAALHVAHQRYGRGVPSPVAVLMAHAVLDPALRFAAGDDLVDRLPAQAQVVGMNKRRKNLAFDLADLPAELVGPSGRSERDHTLRRKRIDDLGGMEDDVIQPGFAFPERVLRPPPLGNVDADIDHAREGTILVALRIAVNKPRIPFARRDLVLLRFARSTPAVSGEG